MNEDQGLERDRLDEAVRAFQGVQVPERPPDADILAKFDRRLHERRPQRRRFLGLAWSPSMRSTLMAGGATAALVFGGLGLAFRNAGTPEEIHVAGAPVKAPELASKTATAPATAPERVPVPPGPRQLTEGRSERLRRKSLDQCVAEAQVIVVATALDSSVAPPKVPGDHPETLLRFRVTRVLKGQLGAEFITTRTPTAAGEFLGREWIVMLSPEYMAGRHAYAGSYTIKLEPEVRAILTNEAR